MTSTVRSIALILTLAAGAVASGSAQTPAPPLPPLSSEDIANFSAAWAQQPRVDLGIPAGAAKVVVVKFNDFQCPMCATTHEWYKPVLDKFEKSNPGAVKFVLKDWPWNTRCNAALVGMLGAPVHPTTCEAAAAARMARDRGKAKEDEMEAWLYASQQTMTAASVKAAAERMLGVKDFDAEYARKLVDIRKDVSDGVALSIVGTPTLFINGVRIPDRQIMPAQYFELAIELELKKAR